MVWWEGVCFSLAFIRLMEALVFGGRLLREGWKDEDACALRMRFWFGIREG